MKPSLVPAGRALALALLLGHAGPGAAAAEAAPAERSAGRRGWEVPWAWSDGALVVDCGEAPGFRLVYAAGERGKKVVKRVARGASSCRGWREYFLETFGVDLPAPATTTCRLAVSPYHDFRVWMDGLPRGWSAAKDCTVGRETRFSQQRVGLALLGAVLFLSAKDFSESRNFRLTSGALLAVTSGMLILAYMGFNQLRRRGKWTWVAMALGTGVAGILGTVMPQEGWEEQTARLLVLYVAGSALAGLTVAYYFEDTLSSQKAVTVFLVAIRLFSAGLLVFSTQLLWVSLACLTLLYAVAAVGLDGLRRVLLRLRGLAATGPAAEAEACRVLTPRLRPPPGPAAAPTPPGRLLYSVDDGRRALPSPVASFQGPPAAPAAFESVDAPSASPASVQYRVLNAATGRWIGRGGDLHRKLLRKGYTQDGDVLTPPSSAAGSDHSGRATPTAAASALRSPPVAADLQAQGRFASPLGLPARSSPLPEGKVLNPRTGRLIAVGGAAFNRLVEAGYVLEQGGDRLVLP